MVGLSTVRLALKCVSIGLYATEVILSLTEGSGWPVHNHDEEEHQLRFNHEKIITHLFPAYRPYNRAPSQRIGICLLSRRRYGWYFLRLWGIDGLLGGSSD
jgi:hypothetical protein